ncbi:MAG: hypothetical protein AAF602_08105, partial [Myxococcota bacterium]
MQTAWWFALTLFAPEGWSSEDAGGARLVPQVGHLASVAQVARSPDGRLVASAGRDGAVGVWHVQTGAMLHRLTVPDAVVAVAFTDGGAAVTGATTGGGWWTWDATTGEVVAERAIEASWTSAQFVGDGERLLAVESGGGAAVWRDDRRLATFEGVVTLRPQSATPDGKWIAATTGDREVGVFKGRSGKRITSLVVGEDTDPFRVVALSPDGRTVVTTNETETATVWSARSGTQITDLVLDDEDRRHVDAGFAPDGTVITMDDRAVYRRWRGSAPEATLETRSLVDRGVFVGADGTVVAPESGGGIGVWQFGGSRVAQLRGTVRPPRVLAADARTLAVGHDDGTASVWNPQAGSLTGVYSIGREPVQSVEIHSSGLLLGVTRRTVSLYDLRWGRRPIFELEKRSSGLRNATLDFMGRELYVADPFGARAWRIERFRSAPLIGERTDWGTVKNSGEYLGEVSTFKVRPRLQAPPGWLALSPEGLTVIDEATGEPRASLYVFDDDNWAVVDPEGRFDTGNPALDGLRWVIDGEPYALGQLRERYYEPGLLAKLLGYNDEPLREVPPLSSVEAPPIVHLVGPSPEGTLEVRIEDRGSGYGGLFATLNGSDISETVTSRCPDLANGLSCALELAPLPTWMPGRDNVVRVEGFSASGVVRSRSLEVAVRGGGTPNEDIPDL